MDEEPEGIPSTGHLAMSGVEWGQARLRAGVIGKLAEHGRVGLSAADEATFVRKGLPVADV